MLQCNAVISSLIGKRFAPDVGPAPLAPTPWRPQQEGVESAAWWRERRGQWAMCVAYYQASEPRSVPTCHTHPISRILPVFF